MGAGTCALPVLPEGVERKAVRARGGIVKGQMCGLVVAKGVSSVFGKGGIGKEAPKGCPLLGGLNARGWGWGVAL